MSNLSPFTFSTPIQGVQVKPLKQDGLQIQIRYTGLLQQQNQPQQIWLHAGYGDLNKWLDVQDYAMEFHADGWEQTVHLQDKQLNFCFYNNTGQWDNNNGDNWIYKII